MAVAVVTSADALVGTYSVQENTLFFEKPDGTRMPVTACALTRVWLDETGQKRYTWATYGEVGPLVESLAWLFLQSPGLLMMVGGHMEMIKAGKS